MTVVYLTRTLAGFSPAHSADAEDLDRIPVGALVSASLRRPRSVPHHRFFMSVLRDVAEGCGRSTEELLDIVKLETGHVRVIARRGERITVPDTIAFARMDQTAFAAFFEQAIAVIAAETGTRQPDLYAEIAAKYPQLMEIVR